MFFTISKNYLLVRNVFSTIRIDVLLGQAEVDYVDDLVLFRPRPSDQEVFRFYISEDEPLAVDVLYSGYELIGYHQHRFQAKPTAAQTKQILQAGS